MSDGKHDVLIILSFLFFFEFIGRFFVSLCGCLCVVFLFYHSLAFGKMGLMYIFMYYFLFLFRWILFLCFENSKIFLYNKVKQKASEASIAAINEETFSNFH